MSLLKPEIQAGSSQGLTAVRSSSLHVATIMASFCLVCLAAACSTGWTSQPEQQKSQVIRSGSFSLAVLDNSLFAGAQFKLLVSQTAEGARVDVRAEQTHELKAVYLQLSYDASLYAPEQMESAGILADSGTPLVLSVASEPGILQHGEVLANWPQIDGYSGSGSVASFSFSRTTDQQGTVRNAASAPASDQAQQYLSYGVLEAQLSWYYANPGDYDQNGLVGISDLTPLGVHFNKAGPFADSSALSVVDGDGNGLISISDITPIGTNFGNQVDSYAVYGSSDAGDYPAGNTAANGPGTRRLATVSLASSLGSNTERRRWEYTMDSPIVGGRYWVRPTSSGEVGTPSKMTSPYQQSWHHVELVDYSPPMLSPAGTGMTMLGGKPSLVYFSSDTGAVKNTVYYMSAEDELGLKWNAPIQVTQTNLSNHTPQLVEITGQPAISWYDDGNGRLIYKRAIDPAGSSWDANVTIVNKYSFLNLLIEHAGKPVSGFRGDGSGFYLSRALDAQGGTWLPGVQQYAPMGQWSQQADMVSLPGGIGSAIEDFSTGALQYVFASVTGSDISPQAPVTVFPGGIGYNLSLAIGIADDKPFVVTRRTPSQKIYFSYAADATGSSWSTPDITGLAGIAHRFDGCGAYGVPWVVYIDEDTGFLHSGHAVAPQSSSWINEANVTEVPPTGGLLVTGIDMQRVGIHPAVTYYETKNKKLMYAIFY